MKLTRRSTLANVVEVVATALRRAGISAVLTGGACATLHSRGAYQSHDLDFIIRGRTTRKALDDAMASTGFVRDGDRYVHPETPHFVEFPRGPLAIGDDVHISPVELTVGRATVAALSATDTCRDRLAAFYHWNDRHSLDVAIQVALRERIDLAKVRRWSAAEGHVEPFAEFLKQLRRARQTMSRPSPRK